MAVGNGIKYVEVVDGSVVNTAVLSSTAVEEEMTLTGCIGAKSSRVGDRTAGSGGISI